ncbi:MAG TPA: GIY-YIG nuclease family protein [Candidatus Bipolaricaulota bacterium]|nr:GIY-YIG nuclease family protein [Candidatus Bipolaricaulota bacterium]
MRDCFTYAISSLSKSYIYVGTAINPHKRIRQHNTGKSRTTKPYMPFEIITIEKFANRKEARKREKYLKSGIGKEYLKSLCRRGEIGRRARLKIV